MKYIVIVPGYPNENDHYSNHFVHTRVRLYLENGLDVVVFNYTTGPLQQYSYEDVTVYTGGRKAYKDFLAHNHFDKYLVHFGFKKILKPILKLNNGVPIVMWVHGTEALGWYRRLFSFDIKRPYKLPAYIFRNTFQMLFMHKFIRQCKQVTYVFVSNWMKDILEKDSFSVGKISNYRIIANVVDEEKFPYKPKNESLRTKILSIRPYSSRKYANDLMVAAIVSLSKEPFFDALSFSIYGDGRLFDSVTKPLRGFKNVSLNKQFLTHEQIRELHEQHGVMLIPTRQDAQGVSMCEAMCSGLVPVTSYNTAIPEFVTENAGYLTTNAQELANAIKELYLNPELFMKKSKEASTLIMSKCSKAQTTLRELELLK